MRVLAWVGVQGGCLVIAAYPGSNLCASPKREPQPGSR